MAVAQGSFRRDITDDATFRSNGKAISDLLATCGLIVKTADTGQINWTTVLKPTAINTVAGYEIYRFADTLQSTKPVYIKIEFGSDGVASGNSLGRWWTVGTGTDGAGTLTGQVSTRIQPGGASTSVYTGLANVYVSCELNRMFVYWDFGSVNMWELIIVERPVNAAGVEFDDSFHFVGSGPSAVNLRVIPFAGGIPASFLFNNNSIIELTTQPGRTSGSAFVVSPLCYGWGGTWRHARGFVHHTSDVTALSVTSVSYLGSTADFLPCPTSGILWPNNASTKPAFRYV